MVGIKATALIALALVGGQAAAQTKSVWSAKAGYNHFFPQVKSGDITGVPGGKVDVGDGGGPFVSAAYMFSDHVSAELGFGLPPKLDIEGRGTIEQAGKIADAKVLSPILVFQYRFGTPRCGVQAVRRPRRDIHQVHQREHHANSKYAYQSRRGNDRYY